MIPIEFHESNLVIAKDQPQYRPLPAHYYEGVVTTCWQLTWRERFKALFYGLFWLQVMTFGKSIQPLMPSFTKPEIDLAWQLPEKNHK